jgi:hypothetical protein
MAGTPVTNYAQQDFNLIPFLNSIAEPVAGSVTPSTGNVGRFYRNTVSGRIEFVLNSTTVASLPYAGAIVDADIAAGAAIANSKLATNPLARANHTGTQLAATVSDFDTQVRTSRLDQLAVPTASVNFNSQKATGLADPSANTDAVNLQYFQSALSAAINGHDWKDGVRVAVGTNVTLTAPGATLDGVTMATNDRVLLYGQTDPTQNGLYQYNGSASTMTRTTDADVSAEVTSGMSVPITGGTNSAKIAILTTGDPITLGTTGLTFTLVAAGATYVQGTGITISGNTISLPTVTVGLGGTGSTTAAGARTNLVVPQRGFAQDLTALTAGVGLDVTHGLGTKDVTIEVYRIADGVSVNIGRARKISDGTNNTITITSDVAVASGILRVVVNPII